MMKMTMTGLCRLCILLMHLFGKLLVRPWPDQPDRVLRLWSEGRMTACPPDQRRPLRRVSDEEVSLAQHVSHDTAVDDVVACCRPWGGPWAALYPEMLHILLQFTTYCTVLSLYSFTLRRLQHYIVFSFSKMINFHVCILWVKNMPLLRITSANIARFSNHYHCGMHPLFRHPLFRHPLFRHLCLLCIFAKYTH